jgi:queuine tRNA-ribosyltransferase
MFRFTIEKQSKKSRARAGIVETAHGTVETPALVAVATQATVKTLTSEEVQAAGSQLVICNTYHLHIRPGESVVKSHGKLHTFMQWKRPLMTDSGGFQVFSLGFGKEHGMGKVLHSKTDMVVEEGDQPQEIKITDEGVFFRSYLDGSELFLNPKESIRIQEALGADIMVAFDECPSPVASHAYVKKSLVRTHRWAQESLAARTSKTQALYGVVQGGRFSDLRTISAQFIGTLPFEGFAIGGEFGGGPAIGQFGINKRAMSAMLNTVTEYLPPEKPRHLLGIGHPEDLLPIIKAGMDTFDCVVPTQYARRGIAFIRDGRLDLRKAVFLPDTNPLDSACACFVCSTPYARGYIAHLLRAHEITALRMLTFHNLFYFNAIVAKIRETIKNGEI